MTPIQASKEVNERRDSSHLQDKRKELNPKIELGDLVITFDIRSVFSTNYSYEFY